MHQLKRVEHQPKCLASDPGTTGMIHITKLNSEQPCSSMLHLGCRNAASGEAIRRDEERIRIRL